MEEDRNLTDADIRALARELRQEFYLNLGKGVWALAWKAIVAGFVIVAAYGAIKGFK